MQSNQTDVRVCRGRADHSSVFPLYHVLEATATAIFPSSFISLSSPSSQHRQMSSSPVSSSLRASVVLRPHTRICRAKSAPYRSMTRGMRCLQRNRGKKSLSEIIGIRALPMRRGDRPKKVINFSTVESSEHATCTRLRGSYKTGFVVQNNIFKKQRNNCPDDSIKFV
jgi:hypothetical protein